MTGNHDAMVRAAMRLRAENSEAWQEFVLAVRTYAAQIAMEMLRCPPDLLQRTQGMGVMASEIAQVLNDAPKHYEKLRNG